MSIAASSQTRRTLCDRQFEAEATERFGRGTMGETSGNWQEMPKP
jgi:hypothetical protein